MRFVLIAVGPLAVAVAWLAAGGTTAERARPSPGGVVVLMLGSEARWRWPGRGTARASWSAARRPRRS
jgi:hypothetical protein